MFQNNQPSIASLNQENEIPLPNILLFLKQDTKIITFFCVIGLSIAVIYLLTAPKQYQAIAQIKMAQIGDATNNKTTT